MIFGNSTRIPVSALSDIQLGAGCIVADYDITHPTTWEDAKIVMVTTGGVTVNIKPTIQDFGADVDNCPEDTAELMYITKYEVTLSTTQLDVGKSSNLKMAIGAADVDTQTGYDEITPRLSVNRTGSGTDFQTLTWVGDLADGRVLAITLENTFSTDGLSIQTKKDEKGSTGVTIKAFYSAANPDTVPVTAYITSTGGDNGGTH